jgi:hypothetical protein
LASTHDGDRASLPERPDELVCDALLFGGTVAFTHDLGVTDGVAATVRFCTH